MREKRLVDLTEAFAEFASHAVAIRKDEKGNLFREDYSKARKFSAKIRILMDPNDEDYNLLKSIMAAELCVSSPDEDTKIEGQHLYAVARRILNRSYLQLEGNLGKYTNVKN